jgi:hypothetical protein
VEPHQEAESDHLRHRRLDAAHQSQGGHQSRGAGRQNQAFRQGQELRLAESVWGAWGDERLQAHPPVAEGCNLGRQLRAHRLGGRDQRLADHAVLSLPEEG